ncbi:putative methyltransferase-domain-containing protein [Pelagophyceae sp. CCMP2097]|nr:putative methyltransferase-domain-containing protein [Pelagophyceae sp. CCMP2097]
MFGNLFVSEDSSEDEALDYCKGYTPATERWPAKSGDAGAWWRPPSGDAAEVCVDAGGVAVRLTQLSGVDALACKGSVVWGCARALCAVLADGAARPPEDALHVDFAGLNVVELGAGTGGLGLWIAAKWPTATVTLTDLAEALPLLRVNAKLNGFHVHGGTGEPCGAPRAVCVREVAFGDSLQGLGRVDVVVAADVLYSVRCAGPLTAQLASTLSSVEAADVWVALQERHGCRLSGLGAFFGETRGTTVEIKHALIDAAPDRDDDYPLRILRTRPTAPS